MSPHTVETNLLAELFDGDVKAPFAEPHHSVVLKETGADAKLKKLTIEHLDAHALVLLLEKGQTTDHRYTKIFAMPEGWTHHKACDAVLLLHFKQQDYIVFVELKSGAPKGCDKQFESAEHFMDYAFSVLEWQKRHPRLKRHHRRVVFNTAKTSCQTLNKLPVNPRKAAGHDITFIQVCNNDSVTPARFC